jgi:hypothetical protein
MRDKDKIWVVVDVVIEGCNLLMNCLGCLLKIFST